MKQYLLAASISRRAARSSVTLHVLVVGALAWATGALAVSACATNTVQVTPTDDASTGATCDESKCAQKNKCIPDANGVVACRLPCTSHAECPWNTLCQPSDPTSYCVKMNVTVARKESGQWGTACLPSGGLTGNPACDAETEFYCYGTGTTDANAYCTRYDCETNLDCAGGFYCATINNAPNVKSDNRSFGKEKTRTVCLKRDYCAPCSADFDCPVLDGKQSRCFDDDAGGKFCSIPCSTTSNCQLDSACTILGEDGQRYCRPRAGVCIGDGSLCAPCRSDADCPSGYCIRGAYSPERFCSVKSKTACTPSGGTASLVKGDCPAFTGMSGTEIGCMSSTSDPSIPKDQCIGVIDWGDTGDIGCYTKH